MSSLLVVRAKVHDPSKRDAFDHWYETEHLGDAHRTFGSVQAWRCWSRTDPLIHYAFYEFSDSDAAYATTESDGIRALIAEFDTKWGESITRTREVIDRVQSI